MTTGDELRATVSARRELGPDYDDALVETFLQKMSSEVDRRVDERLATSASPKALSKERQAADGRALALAIVSVVMGMIVTTSSDERLVVVAWVGIVLVNLIFALGRRLR
ncbi:MAG: hypothetical protein HOY71_08840 [Nonomuraea sp.]|nr:hypothetical protein [Nonomuraea sp.]